MIQGRGGCCSRRPTGMTRVQPLSIVKRYYVLKFSFCLLLCHADAFQDATEYCPISFCLQAFRKQVWPSTSQAFQQYSAKQDLQLAGNPPPALLFNNSTHPRQVAFMFAIWLPLEIKPMTALLL